MALFGDLGSVNSQSIPFLQEETVNGHFDAILHVGMLSFNYTKLSSRSEIVTSKYPEHETSTIP